MSNPTLTHTDLARIAVACQDKAHTYYGGEFGFGQDTTARYVAEGLHNWTLRDRPYHLIREAVGTYFEAHPDVLDLTDEQVRQNQRDRAAVSEEFAGKAHSLWLAGFHDDAVRVIDEAEALNPDHAVAGLYSWDRLRNIIDAQDPECDS